MGFKKDLWRPLQGGSVTCDSSSLVDPLNIGVKSHTQIFFEESLRHKDKLVSLRGFFYHVFCENKAGGVVLAVRKVCSIVQDCRNAKCKYLKCILKDIEVNSNHFVKVMTRIWSGTFITVNAVERTFTAILIFKLGFISLSC